MLQSVRKFILNPWTILVVYVVLAILASIQLVFIGPHVFEGHTYTDYNNYVIFRQSFFHLIQGKNVYMHFPDEQWDLYKYSPTFALAMGLLAYLPDVVGLSMWNVLNALVLFGALRMLPFKKNTQSLLLWFVFLELLTSMQNAQSNGLMAGLMIAAYASMERRKPGMATLWIVIATFIKVYGAVGFALFLFYPDKVKFILYAALWSLLFAVIPLAIMPLHTLIWQYQNWMLMMKEDQSASYGLSVMGWLHSWFGINSGKSLVSLAGIVLFVIPFARWKLYSDHVYKMLILAFMLIWVIIFNHKAESPTYVIAIAGAGIWYFALPRKTWRSVLLAVIFIFTSLSPTDLFPPYLRQHFFVPYTIKAIPCIVLWCIMWVEIMTMQKSESRALNE